MKIGILTLPISSNYGGILQAVALYRFLHNQGHDVFLVYKESSSVLWKEVVKSILIKIPFHDLKDLKANHQLKKEEQKRKEFHRDFVVQEIFIISQDLYTKRDLETFSKQEKLDAVIVGSDQVWRKAYINDIYYKSYFLNFVDSSTTKKIAYSASFGKDHWEGVDDIEDVAKCLKDFDAISTRELSGVDICKDSFKCENAKHVLDPTMLMEKEFYLEIISKYDISNISKGGLVTYILDSAEEKKQIIGYIQKSLTIQKTSHLKEFNSSNVIYTVPQWLASFVYADVVVTDSFHGMVFSIIFEKNFIAIGNKDRGLDRFTSLLSLLGLEDRLVFSLKDIKNKKIEDIDYKVVNKVLDDNKNLSFSFLGNALDDRK
jgi:hypothetical protein